MKATDSRRADAVDSVDRAWIYLDYHATTPVDPRVLERMDDVLRQHYGNPSSPHRAGHSARQVVDAARGQVAESIGALAGEISFTSGATESNNLALQGLARGASSRGSERTKIVTSQVEHKSVSKAAESAAQAIGGTHVRAPVTGEGVVDLGAVKELVDDATLVVSIQAANNEIGSVQPIHDVAEIARSCGAYFHSDAAQALGRLPIDVADWGVDLLSLSAHKAYGPKGIGALYIKGGPSSLPVEPLLVGGGQEQGLRAGTLNVPAIAGFGEACRIAVQDLDEEVVRFAALRDRFEKKVLERLEFAEIVGSRHERLSSTTNIRLSGVEAEAVLARLNAVGLSSGSACEAGAPEPSHVLRALGLDRTAAYECVRVAVGRFTTAADVDEAATRLVDATLEVAAVL